MPTITPSGPAASGSPSSEGPARHRATVKVTTRQDISTTAPRADANGNPTRPAAAPGRQTTSEETAVPRAVTLSPQLTALARRQQKLEQDKAAFEASKGNFVPKDSILAKLQGGKASEALKDLGLTYEQISDALLAEQQGADPVRELKAEIEGLKTAQQETVSKQFEATLKQYKAEAESLVAGDPKAFHMINKQKRADAVVQHIVDTWEENPDSVLTVAQAAKEVEEVLREDAKAQADALAELDAPAEEIAPPPVKASGRRLPPPAERTAPPTLTRQDDAPRETGARVQMQHLSMKDRLAEAVRRAQAKGQ